MPGRKRTDDAVSILKNRYGKGDPIRKASVQEERVNAQVARMVYDLRIEAGLSQKELADLIGTKQPAISRLEDADYDGHSLSMLNRIAEALKRKMVVEMTAEDVAVSDLRYAFHVCMRLLRRERGLSVDALAEVVDIEREEIVAMERNNGYRPNPLTIDKLSRFYEIPVRQLLLLAGGIREVPQALSEQASRFAAKSESFARLTEEEKEVLDGFVQFLREKV